MVIAAHQNVAGILVYLVSVTSFSAKKARLEKTDKDWEDKKDEL